MEQPTNFRRRMRALLAPLGGVMLLAACATATPYQPLGVRGAASGGFYEQRLEANRFRVVFAGNSYTSRNRVENYLLFRAAELTVQNGYDGFTIVDRDTERDVDTRVYRSPGYGGFGGLGYGPYGGWRPSWRYYGHYGWRSWDPWYGSPFWADDIDVRTVERYEATAEIVMFRGARPNDPRAFDARQVMANIGPTIEVPR
jgi:hypothetical protein